MADTLHRIVTGAATAVAVTAAFFAYKAQTEAQHLRVKSEKQGLVNVAVMSALHEQRKLNADLSGAVIRVMRQQAHQRAQQVRQRALAGYSAP